MDFAGSVTNQLHPSAWKLTLPQAYVLPAKARENGSSRLGLRTLCPEGQLRCGLWPDEQNRRMDRADHRRGG
ncbi:MAG: hypothetical protein Rhims3KO_28590 [Hyphomicrobiales bacterium]